MRPSTLELRRLPGLTAEDCDPRTQEDPIHEVVWSMELDGPTEWTATMLPPGDEGGAVYFALIPETLELGLEGDQGLTGAFRVDELLPR